MKSDIIAEESEVTSSAQVKGKKIKKTKEKVGSSTNLATTQDKTSNTTTKRSSKVGTYKEKIKDIVSEDDDLQQEEEDLMIEGLENIDDEARKNEKSRISAKMTRKRRKLYISLLEKKVKQLGDELDQAKLKISGFEQSQKQRQNSEIMTQLLQERQKLFDKLEQKIKEKDDIEIQCTMDSLRLRLGLSGKTRNQALASFYDEIVKLMMPFHMKYLIWIAMENLDIFQADRDCDSTDSVWFQNSGMSESQIVEIREKILQSKKDYDDIIHHLDMLKQKMHAQNEFAQNFIDDLRNFFPPINIAKFLVDLDKKRNLYERNNLYPDSYWQKLQSKNNSLNPLKNIGQGQMIEKPFQNNPNVLYSNTQIKQEATVDNNNNKYPRANKDQSSILALQQSFNRNSNNNNLQSLNSSQCSFSVDQLGQSGILLNHQSNISQQQQLQQQNLIQSISMSGFSDIKSEDGRSKNIINDSQQQQQQYINYNDKTQQQLLQNNNSNSINNHSILPHHNSTTFDRNRNNNIQSSSLNSNTNNNQQYGQQNNIDNNQQIQQQQQQHQFERPYNVVSQQQQQQYQKNYQQQGLNQNQGYNNNNNNNSQQNIQMIQDNDYGNLQNQGSSNNNNNNLNQYQQPQQYNSNNNNINHTPYDYIHHSQSFQFQDPNTNFDLFLLQRDLN